MPNTSTTGGVLLPTIINDNDLLLDRKIHDLLYTITSIDKKLVFPMWQEVPPAIPPINTDWISFGILNRKDDFTGNDNIISDMVTKVISYQDITLLCSIYGSNASRTYQKIKYGLNVSQNREYIRSIGLAYKNIDETITTSTELNKQFYKRLDCKIYFTYKMITTYEVGNLLQADGQFNVDGYVEPYTSNFNI